MVSLTSCSQIRDCNESVDDLVNRFIAVVAAKEYDQLVSLVYPGTKEYYRDKGNDQAIWIFFDGFIDYTREHHDGESLASDSIELEPFDKLSVLGHLPPMEAEVHQVIFAFDEAFMLAMPVAKHMDCYYFVIPDVVAMLSTPKRRDPSKEEMLEEQARQEHLKRLLEQLP